MAGVRLAGQRQAVGGCSPLGYRWSAVVGGERRVRLVDAGTARPSDAVPRRSGVVQSVCRAPRSGPVACGRGRLHPDAAGCGCRTSRCGHSRTAAGVGAGAGRRSYPGEPRAPDLDRSTAECGAPVGSRRAEAAVTAIDRRNGPAGRAPSARGSGRDTCPGRLTTNRCPAGATAGRRGRPSSTAAHRAGRDARGRAGRAPRYRSRG